MRQEGSFCSQEGRIKKTRIDITKLETVVGNRHWTLSWSEGAKKKNSENVNVYVTFVVFGFAKLSLDPSFTITNLLL